MRHHYRSDDPTKTPIPWRNCENGTKLKYMDGDKEIEVTTGEYTYYEVGEEPVRSPVPPPTEAS